MAQTRPRPCPHRQRTQQPVLSTEATGPLCLRGPQRSQGLLSTLVFPPSFSPRSARFLVLPLHFLLRRLRFCLPRARRAGPALCSARPVRRGRDRDSARLAQSKGRRAPPFPLSPSVLARCARLWLTNCCFAHPLAALVHAALACPHLAACPDIPPGPLAGAATPLCAPGGTANPAALACLRGPQGFQVHEGACRASTACRPRAPAPRPQPQRSPGASCLIPCSPT